jgi:hypothetical protein
MVGDVIIKPNMKNSECIINFITVGGKVKSPPPARARDKEEEKIRDTGSQTH